MKQIIKYLMEQIELSNIVEKDDLEIYRFGLECALLKLIHIVSYLIIGICMKSLISLLISGIVLIALRRRTGGFHCNTPKSCYFFSCGIVVSLCLLNRISATPIIIIFKMIMTDIIVFCMAPLENVNHRLKPEKKSAYRKRAIVYLTSINVLVAIIMMIHKVYSCLFLVNWISNGLFFVGMLLFLEYMRAKFIREKINRKEL